MKIWHDDVRPAPKGWTRAYDNPSALKLLSENNVEVISLDHDLGCSPDEGIWARGCSPEGDGKDLVKAMIQDDLVPPLIYIHSWNPGGAREMRELFRDAGYNAIIAPYQAL